jgi:hypothetical protein
MTKTSEPVEIPAHNGAETPVNRVADPAPDPRARRQSCIAELQAVLTRHGCRITPFVQRIDPIGDDGSLWVQRLGYDVVPV